MSKTRGLRLLHLPNEAVQNAQHMQVGSRRALQRIVEAEPFGAYRAFSFLSDFRQSGNARGTWSRLQAIAEEFQPDLIYWQHLGGFPLTRDDVLKLKSVGGNPVLIYHDADAYGRFRKRMDAQIRTLLPLADLVVLSGTGRLFGLARSFGAKRLLVAPQPFDTERFGKPWRPTSTRRYDLVMIGSLGRTRVPGVSLPGNRRRNRLAKLLCERFGDRFALYGHGWEGVACSHGVVPFDRQEEINRSAWLTINWDHFEHLPYYFSNRLAISLAAGVPHITSYHPGYEHMFRDCSGLFWARSPAEALDVAEYLISQGPARLRELGEAAHAFALQHLEADKVYTRIFDAITATFFLPPKDAELGAVADLGS